jgi:hypothetical protein
MEIGGVGGCHYDIPSIDVLSTSVATNVASA